MVADIFFGGCKRVLFNYSKLSFLFDTSRLLFSSAGVDSGSFQLIDSLRKNNIIVFDSVLDLGCGFGFIGVFVKKSHPDSVVYCVDRDSLALDFTRHNADLNECKINVYPSLDYQSVKDMFCLICCNYPAKAGINALKMFVYGASNHLKQGGIFAVVIVKELESDFRSVLNDAGEDIVVLFEKKSSGHIVFHLSFKNVISFDGDPYSRGVISYQLDKKSYTLDVAYNISEFESPSFNTRTIIKLFGRVPSGLNIFVVDPLQGHLPIAVRHYLNPKELHLVSRDLLSLEYSKNNLAKNGFDNVSGHHKIIVDEEKGDLLLWSVDDDLEISQIKILYDTVKNNFGKIIIASGKGRLKNILRALKVKPKVEMEENGCMAVMICRVYLSCVSI